MEVAEQVELKVPKLRFREFEGLLSERSLGEVATWKSGGTPPKDVPQYWEGDLPWISASEMRGKFYSTSQYGISEEGLRKGSKLAVKGSLLLLTRGSMLFNKIPIGITSVDVAFNQDIKSLNPVKGVDLEFLYQWFCFKEHRLMNLVGGTGIGAGKLDTSELKSIILNLPTHPEQQKIAGFLSAVDEKLQNLNRKKELIQQYKKGVMQKLFSQELRFKQADGTDYPDWDEKRLGEVCIGIKSGKTNSSLHGQFPLYGSTGKIGFCDNFSHQGEFILIARVGANAGAIKYIDDNFGVTDNTLIMEPNEELIIKFLFYKLEKFNLNRLIFGSGQPLITGGQLKALKIQLPSKEEQQKIADFLSSLDEKIDAVSAQVELTQQFKKGLLQEMFV